MNLPPLPALKWGCLCTKCGRSWVVDEKPTAPACLCGYMPFVGEMTYYTADQVRQAQRDAVAAAVPEGWKLAPIEPTDGMRAAGRAYFLKNYMDIFSSEYHYQEMLEAAPEVNS